MSIWLVIAQNKELCIKSGDVFFQHSLSSDNSHKNKMSIINLKHFNFNVKQIPILGQISFISWGIFNLSRNFVLRSYSGLMGIINRSLALVNMGFGIGLKNVDISTEMKMLKLENEQLKREIKMLRQNNGNNVNKIANIETESFLHVEKLDSASTSTSTTSTMKNFQAKDDFNFENINYNNGRNAHVRRESISVYSHKTSKNDDAKRKSMNKLLWAFGQKKRLNSNHNSNNQTST